MTVPPTSTSQLARPRSTRPTRSRTAPSSIRTSKPGWSTEPSTAGAIGRSPSLRDVLARDRHLLAALELDRLRRARRRGASGPAGRRSARPGGRRRPAAARIASARAGVILVRAVREVEPGAVDHRPHQLRSSSTCAASRRDAGPIVATIFVRRGTTAMRRTSASVARLREGVPPRIRRPGSPSSSSIRSELVVLRRPVGARRRARLDLPGAERDREVGDRRVLGLAGAVRHHGRVAARLREPHRLDRLGQRPDLVHLDEDRVADAALDPLAEPLRVRDEEVVADELDAVAELARQLRPRVPVVLGEPVLDRDDRVALARARPRRRASPRSASRGPRTGRRRRAKTSLVAGSSAIATPSRWPARSAASRITSIAASLDSRSGAKPPSSPTPVASPRSPEHAASARGRPRRRPAALRRSVARRPGRP